MENMEGDGGSDGGRGGTGSHRDVTPVLLYSSLLSPKKNMATVPGPVCAPIVVPML